MELVDVVFHSSLLGFAGDTVENEQDSHRLVDGLVKNIASAHRYQFNQLQPDRYAVRESVGQFHEVIFCGWNQYGRCR